MGCSNDWIDEVLVQALDAYTIDSGAASLQLLNATNNIVYQVRVLGRNRDVRSFVLRIHRSPDVITQALASELEWLHTLQTTHLRVPTPVPTRDATLFGVVTGFPDALPRYHTLFNWLEGQFLPTKQQDNAAATQVGYFTASLHQQSQTFVPSPAFTRRSLDAEHLFDWPAIEAARDRYGLFTNEQITLFHSVQERVQHICRHLDTRQGTYGLIHADLIWKNYFFHEQGVGAVDFESCGWGYYLYDLAPTLVGYYDEPHYESLRAGLLKGYRAVRPLLVEDEAMLDVFMAARHVVSCAWLARRVHDERFRLQAPEIVASRTKAIRLLLAAQR